MGNVDFTADTKLMTNFHAYTAQFNQQKPLFHV